MQNLSVLQQVLEHLERYWNLIVSIINLSFQSPKLFPSIVTDFLADGSPNNVSLIFEQ